MRSLLRWLANPIVIVALVMLCGSGCIAFEIVRPTISLWLVEAERDAERIERQRLTDEAIKSGEPLDWSNVDTSKLENLSTGPAPTDEPR